MRRIETYRQRMPALIARRDARAWRRAPAFAAIALLVIGTPRRADAQADVPLGVRRELGTPFAPVRAIGDVALCRALDCERTLSAGLELAPAARWRLIAEGAAGRTVLQPTAALSADARVDLFYGTDERQLWIGHGTGSARGIDSVGPGLNRWLEYGAAFRWRAVSVAVNVGNGSQAVVGGRATTNEQQIIQSIDSLTGAVRVDTITRPGNASSALARARWSSTALRLGWRSNDWRLGVVLGRSTAAIGRPVTWTTTEIERRIGRSLGVVASLGTYPGTILATVASAPRARWMLGVGLTAATGRRAHDAPSPPAAAPAAEAFAAIRLSPGRYRVVAHVAGAAQVELASDLTGWKPVVMQRESGDAWSADLHASSGAHRISLRVDGGAWMAPPGLLGEDDGFGGSAATFVVP
jgi:hypothetical protein